MGKEPMLEEEAEKSRDAESLRDKVKKLLELKKTTLTTIMSPPLVAFRPYTPKKIAYGEEPEELERGIE